jgi:hypothetical protein
MTNWRISGGSGENVIVNVWSLAMDLPHREVPNVLFDAVPIESAGGQGETAPPPSNFHLPPRFYSPHVLTFGEPSFSYLSSVSSRST